MVTVPTYLVADLSGAVRLDSDLNNSQVYTDGDIARLISDAGADLYDKFTSANQHYNISTFDFTLAGGVGGNTVTLPADFQQGHGVDVNPDTAQPYTLRFLTNWLDRNRLTTSPFFTGAPGGGPREYYIQSSSPATLGVLPAMSAAGKFRLYYTPMWTPLAAPIAITNLTPDVDGQFSLAIGSDHTSSPSTYILSGAPHGGFAGQSIQTSGWVNAANNGVKLVTAYNPVTNAVTVSATNIVTETSTSAVTASLLKFNQSGGTWSALGFANSGVRAGDAMTVTGSQAGNNGTFTILSVSGTTVTTSPAGLTNETFGSGASITVQSAGTRPDLPTFMNPWILYLKTMAIITIKSKRGQEVATEVQRLAVQQARIESILQNRVEEPEQPPLTRNTGFWGGW